MFAELPRKKQKWLPDSRNTQNYEQLARPRKRFGAFFVPATLVGFAKRTLMISSVVVLSMSTLLTLPFMPSVYAQGAFEITGTVSNANGNGVQDASVTAISPNSTTVLFGPSSTISDGSYSLFVDEGTYDFHFDPPVGSGLSPVVQSNIVISGSQTINVQFAPAPPVTNTYSGNITDNNNAAVSNMFVRLGSSGAVTNGSGHFTLNKNPGVYDVSFDNSFFTGSVSGVSSANFVTGNFTTVDLSQGGVSQDFGLGFARLTVTVNDSSGNPVASRLVNNTGNLGNGTVVITSGSNTYTTGLSEVRINRTTDGSGQFTLLLPNGATLGAGTLCTTFADQSRVCNSTAITATTQDINLVLAQPQVLTRNFSGTITDNNNNAVRNMFIKLGSRGVLTEASGHFSTDIPPGTYDMSFDNSFFTSTVNSIPTANFTTGNFTTVDLSATNVSQDFSLGLVKLTITTKDAAGNPVPGRVVNNNANPGSGTTVITSGSSSYSTSLQGVRFNSTTSGSGTITFWLPQGAVLPGGSLCTTFGLNTQACYSPEITATSDISIEINEPFNPVFSGKLTDTNNNAIRNMFVALDTNSGGITDASGNFNAPVSAGVHNVSLDNSFFTATVNGTRTANFKTGVFTAVDLSQSSVTQDFSLDLVRLTVTVKNDQGDPEVGDTVTNRLNPGSGTTVITSGSSSYSTSLQNVNFRETTNGSGVITILLPHGAALGVGSICATLADHTQVCNNTAVTTTQDVNLVFQQQPVDTTPPEVKTVALSPNLIAAGATTNLTATIEDNTGGSGVVGAEYYTDTDPGVGNATPMAYSNGQATATFGATLGVGVYAVYVRAQDALGNWSLPANAMLVVTDPASTIRMTGKNKKDLVPSLANGDHLPGLVANNQTDAADYGFIVQHKQGTIDPKSDFQFVYNTGTNCSKPTAQNCHTFNLSSTSFDWLVVDGTNSSRGRTQGVATVTVDGVTTTNPFTLEGIDGDLLSPATDDRLTLKVYSPGADPSTASPLWQASGTMPKGNSVVLH